MFVFHFLDATQTSYEVSVVTGSAKNSGTGANVFVTIYGESGDDTGKRPLKEYGGCFNKGKTGTFKIDCIDIGKIKKLRIEHDNSGLWGAAWFIDSLTVTQNGKNWMFPVNDWLDKKKGDGETFRDVLAVDN